MSSRILRSVMKSVTRRSDVPRRNFSSSPTSRSSDVPHCNFRCNFNSSPPPAPFINVDRLLTWAVRVVAFAGGGVIGYRIGGDPGGDRERCWQKNVEYYHEHKHLNCDLREEIKWYNEQLKKESTPKS